MELAGTYFAPPLDLQMNRLSVRMESESSYPRRLGLLDEPTDAGSARAESGCYFSSHLGAIEPGTPVTTAWFSASPLCSPPAPPPNSLVTSLPLPRLPLGTKTSLPVFPPKPVLAKWKPDAQTGVRAVTSCCTTAHLRSQCRDAHSDAGGLGQDRIPPSSQLPQEF